MWITFCFFHSCISFVHPNIISRKQQFKQSPVVLEDTEYSHQMQSLLIGMNESLDFFANYETVRADIKEAEIYS